MPSPDVGIAEALAEMARGTRDLAEEAAAIARHFRPKFEACRDAGGSFPDEAAQHRALRLYAFVVERERDAKRLNHEAETLEQAAATLRAATAPVAPVRGDGEQGASSGPGCTAEPEPAGGLGPSGEHPSREGREYFLIQSAFGYYLEIGNGMTLSVDEAHRYSRRDAENITRFDKRALRMVPAPDPTPDSQQSEGKGDA